MRVRNSRPRGKQKPERFGLLKLIVGVALVAWVVRSLIFAPFNIPSGSMLPTLYVGDYLVVAKWPYGYSRFSFPWQFPPIAGRIPDRLPERGDVVVFRPTGQEGTDFVKRVIGLPGDSIEMRGGALVLNGRPVRRESAQPFALPVSANSPCRRITDAGIAMGATQSGRCLYSAYRETLPNGVAYQVLDQRDGHIGDDMEPVQVPAGHVFLMGDNRDDSMDSRFGTGEGGIGFVPVEHLVGRATMIFWSTDGSASYWLPWTWLSALRGDRIGSGFGSGA